MVESDDNDVDLENGNGFANEPDLARLSRAYGKMASDWNYALSEFTSLADQGSVMSMLYIAQAYQRGIGAPIDLEQYEGWLQRAKRGGSILATYKLGLLYLREEKYNEAEGYLLQAASAGFTPAAARLGLLYARGQEIQFDRMRARQFLENAAHNGHLAAKRNLARLLIRENFGVQQKIRGITIYLTIPYFVAKIAYRHSRSKDGRSLRHIDEQVH